MNLLKQIATRAHIVYITRIAWWCHGRNLILMNHELFTGDAPISVLPCMCDITSSRPTSADPRVCKVIDGISGRIITGPTQRSVQLLIVRYGERVSPAITSRCARTYTTHPYLLTLTNLFDHRFDKVQSVFGSVCASSLDELTWSAESKTLRVQVHLFTYLILLICFCFLHGNMYLPYCFATYVCLKVQDARILGQACLVVPILCFIMAITYNNLI